MSDFNKWVGNDIANFVSRYRRPITGTLLGGAGGALLGAGLGSVTPALGAGTGAAWGGAMGGFGGLAAGYTRDQEKRAEERALMDKVRQETEKGRAGEELDAILDPYKPVPTTFPEDPYVPPVAVNPGVDPRTTGDEATLPGLDPRLGNIPVGGGAGPDVQTIMDEAERAKQLQLDLSGQQSTSRNAARAALAEMLNAQMERQFSDQIPGYLEDLNSKGLLRSSALGDRLSTERSKMAAGVNEQLALQGIQDQYGSIGELTGIQDQYLGARQGALGRKFSLEDYARQVEASKLLGQAAAPVTPYSGGGKSGAGQAGLAGASAVGSIAGLGK